MGGLAFSLPSSYPTECLGGLTNPFAGFEVSVPGLVVYTFESTFWNLFMTKRSARTKNGLVRLPSGRCLLTFCVAHLIFLFFDHLLLFAQGLSVSCDVILWLDPLCLKTTSEAIGWVQNFCHSSTLRVSSFHHFCFIFSNLFYIAIFAQFNSLVNAYLKCTWKSPFTLT